MQYLYEHGIHPKVLTGIDLDTTRPTDRAVFGFLAVMAEFEHALRHKRTLAGLAAARARGRVGGRRHVLSPEQVRLARQMLAGGMGKTAIAKTLGCARSTLYRSLWDAPGLNPTPPPVPEYRHGVGV